MQGPFKPHFMAREVRCRVTDRQRDRHDNYSNPRCASAPRIYKASAALAWFLHMVEPSRAMNRATKDTRVLSTMTKTK